jgi:hypothetical protein
MAIIHRELIHRNHTPPIGTLLLGTVSYDVENVALNAHERSCWIKENSGIMFIKS